jgi:hypothetical protein
MPVSHHSHRPRRVVGWIAASLTALALVVLALRGGDEAKAPPSHSATSSAAAPSPDPSLLRLHGDLSRLRRDVETLAASAAIDHAGAATASVEPPMTAEERAAAEAERLQRTTVALEAAMRDTAPDPGWSPQTETLLRDGFAAASRPGAHLDAVVCRAALCRMLVRFDSARAIEANLDAILTTITWDTRGFTSVDPERPLEVAIYAAREAHLFPAVE